MLFFFVKGVDVLTTINDRIKYLRKVILELNQEDFSDKINISRSNLGNIEIGRINVTDRVINDICRELGVEEQWLRIGEKPIFCEMEDPFSNEIVKIYNNLTDDNKKYLKGYISRLIEEQKKESKESE